MSFGWNNSVAAIPRLNPRWAHVCTLASNSYAERGMARSTSPEIPCSGSGSAPTAERMADANFADQRTPCRRIASATARSESTSTGWDSAACNSGQLGAWQSAPRNSPAVAVVGPALTSRNAGWHWMAVWASASAVPSRGWRSWTARTHRYCSPDLTLSLCDCDESPDLLVGRRAFPAHSRRQSPHFPASLS